MGGGCNGNDHGRSENSNQSQPCETHDFLLVSVSKGASLRTQERLDRASLAHRAVAFGHLIKRQNKVKNISGIDFPVPHESDELGEVATHRSRAAVKMDVRVEELVAFQRYA